LRLLFFAPYSVDKNVVDSVDCGLGLRFLRFPHAEPKPDRVFGDRMAWSNKKTVNETPVEEPNLVDKATPFGVGISLTVLSIGFHT